MLFRNKPLLEGLRGRLITKHEPDKDKTTIGLCMEFWISRSIVGIEPLPHFTHLADELGAGDSHLNHRDAQT